MGSIGDTEAKVIIAIVTPAPRRARSLLDATRVLEAGTDQREIKIVPKSDGRDRAPLGRSPSIVSQLPIGISSCTHHTWTAFSLVHAAGWHVATKKSICKRELLLVVVGIFCKLGTYPIPSHWFGPRVGEVREGCRQGRAAAGKVGWCR